MSPPNQFLTLSLAARVPTIHVKTDELLHVKEIVEWCNAKKAVVKVKTTEQLGESTIQPDTVYLTNIPAEGGFLDPALYFRLKLKKSTCVWVNTKEHPLHMVTGQMVAPVDMVKEELLKHLKDPKELPEVLPSVGGLTLKEVFELCRVTAKRDGECTATGINKTRQARPVTMKGLSQVSAEYDFYDVPASLAEIVKGSLKFFHGDAPVNALAPRGLLFDGPPGTGKTLGAKYLADHLHVPLYRLDVAGMKGKYVGDSEGALQGALSQLDQSAPCVVLIDEVEKLFRRDTTAGDSGVTLGLLGSMLWWLQEHSSRVLTVMTTNNLKALPPELHREGRVSATLVFNGLETEDSLKKFVYASVANVQKKFVKLTDAETKSLLNDVGEHCVPLVKEGPVSHAKVAQVVNDAYTKVLVDRKES